MVGKLQLVPSLALEFLGMPKSWESYLSPVGSQPELWGRSWHQQHPVPLRLEVARSPARWRARLVRPRRAVQREAFQLGHFK